MKQKRIMLPTVEEAKEFVAAASRCDFDIDVFYNRIIIDFRCFKSGSYQSSYR